MLHSIIIGLTLGVTDEFIVLFIVLIFHQMFEGLGLGSRLSQLNLPPHLKWAPYIAGALYSVMTYVNSFVFICIPSWLFLTLYRPIGVAAGYGARSSYNDNGATKNAVSGVLDAFSAGILLYTGLVEVSLLLTCSPSHKLTFFEILVVGSRNPPQPKNDEGFEWKTNIHLHMYASR
jgi:zinc transporter 1/2/3